MSILDHNLTTVERYRPVAEASKAKDAARENWKQAYLAWEENHSDANHKRMVDTSIAFYKANDLFMEVSMAFKHNKGTVDGSQTGVLESLKDAGFGDFGPM